VRVAIVTPEYPPHHIGGGGVAVEALAREYAKNNEVRVFSAWDSNRSWRGSPAAESIDGIAITRYPLIPILQRRLYLRSVLPPNPKSGLRLWRDLIAWSPDIAHLHGYGCAIVDLAAIILSRQRIPYILTVHGLPQTPSQRGRVTRLAYRAYKVLGADRTTRKAHWVTAVSRAVADLLPPERQILVIPNGISALPPSDKHRADVLRRQLQLESGVPLIVAVGRLSKSKGFDVLLRALSFIDAPRLECVIVGSDAGEKKLLDHLASLVPGSVRVLLPGWVDRESLADIFELADVITVPSRDEPFGLVALEALGSRRRVVASNVGGLAEFLRPPVAELIDTEDPHAWAAGISRALSRGPYTQDDDVVAGKILTEHSWPRLAREYELLLMNSRDQQSRVAATKGTH
jgi:glycosyltransferase involved in cell wall biosynthesis